MPGGWNHSGSPRQRRPPPLTRWLTAFLSHVHESSPRRPWAHAMLLSFRGFDALATCGARWRILGTRTDAAAAPSPVGLVTLSGWEGWALDDRRGFCERPGPVNSGTTRRGPFPIMTGNRRLPRTDGDAVKLSSSGRRGQAPTNHRTSANATPSESTPHPPPLSPLDTDMGGEHTPPQVHEHSVRPPVRLISERDGQEGWWILPDPAREGREMPRLARPLTTSKASAEAKNRGSCVPNGSACGSSRSSSSKGRGGSTSLAPERRIDSKSGSVQT